MSREVVEEEGVEGEGALVEVGQDEMRAHRVASLCSASAAGHRTEPPPGKEGEGEGRGDGHDVFHDQLHTRVAPRLARTRVRFIHGVSVYALG